MSKKAASAGRVVTLHRNEDVKRFEKAAKAYGKKATASREAARATLVSLGIHTKSGRLTKKYS
jgi:hypothetical protein